MVEVLDSETFQVVSVRAENAVTAVFTTIFAPSRSPQQVRKCAVGQDFEAFECMPFKSGLGD